MPHWREIMCMQISKCMHWTMDIFNNHNHKNEDIDLHKIPDHSQAINIILLASKALCDNKPDRLLNIVIDDLSTELLEFAQISVDATLTIIQQKQMIEDDWAFIYCLFDGVKKANQSNDMKDTMFRLGILFKILDNQMESEYLARLRDYEKKLWANMNNQDIDEVGWNAHLIESIIIIIIRVRETKEMMICRIKKMHTDAMKIAIDITNKLIGRYRQIEQYIPHLENTLKFLYDTNVVDFQKYRNIIKSRKNMSKYLFYDNPDIILNNIFDDMIMIILNIIDSVREIQKYQFSVVELVSKKLVISSEMDTIYTSAHYALYRSISHTISNDGIGGNLITDIFTNIDLVTEASEELKILEHAMS